MPTDQITRLIFFAFVCRWFAIKRIKVWSKVFDWLSLHGLQTVNKTNASFVKFKFSKLFCSQEFIRAR